MRKESVQDLQGISGWLMLPALGIILSIPRIAYTIISNCNDILFDDVLQLLSSPDSPHYVEGFLFAFIFEIAGNIIVLTLYIYLAYLFFKKNYKTPKYYIIVLIIYLIFILLDIIITLKIFGSSAIEEDTIKEAIRAIITCIIWIPYFLVSIRVKNTFINGNSSTDNISNKSEIVF